MYTVKKMLDLFYAGKIKQSDLELLFDSFLNDSNVREEWPSDASVIIPLALARKDAHSRSKIFTPHRNLRVAAAIFGIVVAIGSASVYAMEQQPQIYSTDANCDMVCAEQWLKNTIETAL